MGDGSRVFHFGEYEGLQIEDVVELDPAYILWAAENEKDHNISQRAMSRARQLLDAPQEDDDSAYLLDEITGLPRERDDYDYE